MFDYQFTNESSKQYKRLDRRVKKRVNEALNEIMESPFRHPHIGKLRGRKNGYKYRLGDYRILYHVNKQEKMCTIINIVTREGAY